MLRIVIVASVIFPLAIVMTMAGRGGGNFYVLTLVLAGIPMHKAATTGQFMLFTTTLAASIIFRKAKTLSVPLALYLGGVTASSAFFGGFEAHIFSGRGLKFVFSILLAIAGATMLFPIRDDGKTAGPRPGRWNLKAGDSIYAINLWASTPFAAAAGFFSGMVGVSGGSFLVPLMVLTCGVPMHVAVGTASVMISATAFAGFLGHALHESFDPALTVPIAAVAILGGILGGRITLKAKPKYLKMLFALTTLAAAVLMFINASLTK